MSLFTCVWRNMTDAGKVRSSLSQSSDTTGTEEEPRQKVIKWRKRVEKYLCFLEPRMNLWFVVRGRRAQTKKFLFAKSFSLPHWISSWISRNGRKKIKAIIFGRKDSFCNKKKQWVGSGRKGKKFLRNAEATKRSGVCNWNWKVWRFLNVHYD